MISESNHQFWGTGDEYTSSVTISAKFVHSLFVYIISKAKFKPTIYVYFSAPPLFKVLKERNLNQFAVIALQATLTMHVEIYPRQLFSQLPHLRFQTFNRLP